MIPAEAVEAAVMSLDPSWGEHASREVWQAIMREALEAAAPYMLASVAKLADEWHEQGEALMADSKTPQMDENISVELLKEGAAMVENARHIRNALAGAR